MYVKWGTIFKITSSYYFNKQFSTVIVILAIKMSLIIVPMDTGSLVTERSTFVPTSFHQYSSGRTKFQQVQVFTIQSIQKQTIFPNKYCPQLFIKANYVGHVGQIGTFVHKWHIFLFYCFCVGLRFIATIFHKKLYFYCVITHTSVELNHSL